MLTDYSYDPNANHQLEIKERITEKLYSQQLLHWNKKLHNLSYRNAMTYGRTEHFNSLKFGIWFQGREYHSIPAPGFDAMNPEDRKVFCMELNPSNENLYKEMSIIADELGSIESEIVLVERFISNLVLFKAPPDTFKEILGDILYQSCAYLFEKIYSNNKTYNWDRNAEFSINTYVQENQKVLQLIRQRLLVNLITIQEYR